MSGNWIKLHRDVFEHMLFASSPMSEREAWIWLITKAAWEDTRQRIGCNIVDVPRGSCLVSRKELMEAFSWSSNKKLDQFLKLLENENMIVKTIIGSGSSMRSLVSIVNYDVYQGFEGDCKGITNTPQKGSERGGRNSPKTLVKSPNCDDCYLEEGLQTACEENAAKPKKGTAHFIKEINNKINNKYIYIKPNPIGLVKKEKFDFSKNDFADPFRSDADLKRETQTLEEQSPPSEHMLDQFFTAKKNRQCTDVVYNKPENIPLVHSVQKADYPVSKNKRGTQIGSFRPDLNFALQKGLTIDEAEREAERFYNYWIATGGTKKDWPATWRNWILSDFGALAKKKRTTTTRITNKPDKVMESIRNNLGNFLQESEQFDQNIKY